MRENAFVLLSLVMASVLAERPAWGQQVACYGMFESAIANTRTYNNPFTDTTLTATFTSPSQRQVTVDGFYDGEQTWRVRFMPDELGQWSYGASFSDGAPGTNGSFQCLASNLHGPLRVNQGNKLWFEHADGTPFYVRSFHLPFVSSLDSQGILLSTLDYLKGQGFSAIGGPHFYESYTLLPWERNGSTVDFSRFNLTVWQRLDKVLRELEARGMVLIPFNVMGGTNDVPKIDTSANRDLFLRYWVARWGGFWNASFQPCSEWWEGYSESVILQILNRIHELDGGRHLISVHSWGTAGNSPALQQAAAYNYYTIQDKLTDYNPTKYTWFVGLYNQVNKPILAHECLWEGNIYQQEAGMDMNNMRRGAWVIALCGGQINYADQVIPPRQYQTQDVRQPNFSADAMTMQPCGWLYPYLKILGGVLQSLPFSLMTLQPSLSSTGVCLAQPGARYLAYAPSGGAMTLDLRSVGGNLNARWLNPRSGEMGQPFQVQGGAVRQFTAPDANDWTLYVQASGVPDPPEPDPVTNFVAEAGMGLNTLVWTNPPQGGFLGTTVRFSTTGYPATPTDGDLVAEKAGAPGSSDSYVHTGLDSQRTYYYSAFAHNWFMNYAPAAHTSAVVLSPGDFDRDGDVDQEDFGRFQACLSGYGRPFPAGCADADLDKDNDVDQNDFGIFQACMGGAEPAAGVLTAGPAGNGEHGHRSAQSLALGGMKSVIIKGGAVRPLKPFQLAFT